MLGTLTRMTPSDTPSPPSHLHPEENDRISETRPEIQLVIGPVGAGKSTFGLTLAYQQRAVRLTLDEWMATLFRPDRPDRGVIEWYVERSARCIEQIWSVAEAVLGAGTSVILELGLLTRRERESFYERVDVSGFPLTVHVVDAARAVRRERVAARNQARGPTFSTVVPPQIFELASDLWEAPDATECEGRVVRFVRTDA
jgi:predicted kinase